MVPQDGPGERPGGDEASIAEIVSAVADDAGVDPVELPPLGETVDPDALVDLLAADSAVAVSFEYVGRRVEIGSDREVRVDDPRDDR
ncbi:MAG: HalOD1 output domain-containing protein [Halosimplex sp.]